MSHGVHAVQHEAEHKMQHDSEHGGHGGGGKGLLDARNKKVALLIAVIALCLAFSETLGKSAQTAAHQLQRRGVEPVGVLPGQDHPPDRA